LKEHPRTAAFQGDAFPAAAPKKDAALPGIKRKEIGSARDIRTVRIFLFQRLGILREKAGGGTDIRQPDARKQHQPLGIFLFKRNVIVAVPFRGHGLGARLVDKLPQHFLPSQLAQGILLQQYPVLAGYGCR
jgi:hypothetical protein